MNFHSTATVTLLLASACALSACSVTPSSPEPTQTSTTISNCGHEFHFPVAPHNVALLDSAPVETLSLLGVLDRVSVKAGLFPTEYFDAATNTQLDKIPTLTDRLDATGHLMISKEEIVARHPDAVLGSTDTINAATMGTTTPVIEEPGFCGEITSTTTFDDVWEQIRLYGDIFDREDRAEEVIEQLKKELPAGAPTGLRAAVLYPTVGGGVTYAYGATSMSTAVLNAAGVDNVFADSSERVFEVSAEELLARRPDFVIILFSDPALKDATVAAAQDLHGADSLPALRENKVVPMLLNFAEPPTPLAITGTKTVDEFISREFPGNAS